MKKNPHLHYYTSHELRKKKVRDKAKKQGYWAFKWDKKQGINSDTATRGKQR